MTKGGLWVPLVQAGVCIVGRGEERWELWEPPGDGFHILQREHGWGHLSLLSGLWWCLQPGQRACTEIRSWKKILPSELIIPLSPVRELEEGNGSGLEIITWVHSTSWDLTNLHPPALSWAWQKKKSHNNGCEPPCPLLSTRGCDELKEWEEGKESVQSPGENWIYFLTRSSSFWIFLRAALGW